MMIAVFIPKKPMWKDYDKSTDLADQLIDPARLEWELHT